MQQTHLTDSIFHSTNMRMLQEHKCETFYLKKERRMAWKRKKEGKKDEWKKK